MLDKESAKQKVLEHINENLNSESSEVVILDDKTIEKEFGWGFFYNSKAYVESGVRFVFSLQHQSLKQLNAFSLQSDPSSVSLLLAPTPSLIQQLLCR